MCRLEPTYPGGVWKQTLDNKTPTDEIKDLRRALAELGEAARPPCLK